MKNFTLKLMAMLILVPLLSVKVPNPNDTATLQAMLNKGDVTLQAKTYYVTGLNVTHNLNLNGAIIQFTPTKGRAISVNGPNVTISHGRIIGTWLPSQPYETSGSSGIVINADNFNLTSMQISNFSSYGVVCGPYNNIALYSGRIEKTGYIAFYYDAESKNTSNVSVKHWIFDRSALPANTITQDALAIRGCTSCNVTVSNVTVQSNTFIMPKYPKDWSAACFELRHCLNGNVSNNTFTGGSMGVSVVACNNVSVIKNKITDSKMEGIEFAAGNGNGSVGNNINGSQQAGMLIDAQATGVTSTADTISNTNQSNTNEASIHIYIGSKKVIINSPVLKTNSVAVSLQQASDVQINDAKITGLNAVAAFSLDTSIGNVSVNRGSVDGFRSVFSIYSVKSGLITDNVSIKGTVVSRTATIMINNTSKGASVGKNLIMQPFAQ